MGVTILKKNSSQKLEFNNGNSIGETPVAFSLERAANYIAAISSSPAVDNEYISFDHLVYEDRVHGRERLFLQSPGNYHAVYFERYESRYNRKSALVMLSLDDSVESGDLEAISKSLFGMLHEKNVIPDDLIDNCNNNFDNYDGCSIPLRDVPLLSDRAELNFGIFPSYMFEEFISEIGGFELKERSKFFENHKKQVQSDFLVAVYRL